MNIQMMLTMILSLHILSANSGPLAPALYVFGDSLVDSGNNNFLPTLARAHYLPYGINFEKGPTGRFTNGRTVADFIADYLGLPYAPPYLRLRLRLLEPKKVQTGLNYASGSSGILPQTGAHLGKVLNLEDQINFFERTVKKEIPRLHFNNSEEVSKYLSKSIFVIATGNNDYDPTKHNSPQSFADLLIRNLSQYFQRLYKLGARKVIVFEIGPIGCMPYNKSKFKHNGTCVEEFNQFAIIFNHKLVSMLRNLTSSLHASFFIPGRINGLGYDAIINPSKYGMNNTSNPCCVTWFNGTTSCIPGLRALTCKDPEKHYFFDAYHPTETVYKTIATLCFNGSSICTPNIQQLVSQN